MPSSRILQNTDPYDSRKCLTIILAAGEGSRMRSRTPKVLHRIAGLSMLGHVLKAVSEAGADKVVVVVGPDRHDVSDEARSIRPDVNIVTQTERLGTAHACLMARSHLAEHFDDVLVVFADTPLVKAATYQALRTKIQQGASVAALAFNADDPTGYGRLLLEGDTLSAIREHKDASEQERHVGLCNAGLMAFAGKEALTILDSVSNTNAQHEFYLTDCVAIAAARGLTVTYALADQHEVMGVNDRVQLSQAEGHMQHRLRARAMLSGVTMIDPASVTLSHDTIFGRDVLIEPHCVFDLGVKIEDGVTIKAFCHLEGATIGPDSVVGPYARLRPGSRLASHVRIGNFVELKNVTLDEGVKVNHLTYLGDASVGTQTNIGAGTITCNYDGFAKHKTTIGSDAFIGSNSALIAPVTIGEGAYVATGSVITDDVPADALAIARGRQVNKPHGASGLRQKLSTKN